MNITDLDQFALSPLNIVDTMFRDLRDRKGEDYVPVDASNPVFHIYEMSAQLHADSNRRLENTDKRHYAVMGETEEELYAGMFGVDYLDRFASPGATTLTVRIPVDEIIKYAVVDSQRNLKTLVIGKDSSFVAQGTTCTLSYPIEIRVLPSDGIQVVWDLSNENELDIKESEQIDYTRYIPGGYNYEVIDLVIPIKQFQITSNVSETDSAGFNQRYQFPNSLYHVNVSQMRGGVWVPIETTHSALTYDPSDVTAVLKRVDNELEVWIPQIYFEKGIVGSPIKVDILSTLGGEERSLTELELGQWSYEWDDLDAVTLPAPNAAMSSLNAIQVFANSDLRGGNPEKTLAELRARKLTNAKQRTMPIMSAEIINKGEDLGYKVKLVKDAIGDRNYWLTRNLPAPVINVGTGTSSDSVEYSLAPVNGSLVTVSKTLSELKVLDNSVWEGELLTIHSSQAWLYNAGLCPVDENTLNVLKEDKATWVNWLNENDLVYSPYYYAFDNEGQYLSVDIYDMDNPKHGQHRFLKENGDTNLMCSTGSVRVVKVKEGYAIYVSSKRSENLAELDSSKVACQLSMTPTVGIGTVATSGKLVGETGGELIYRFDLPSELLIESGGAFKIKDLIDRNGNKWDTHCELAQAFTIIWMVDNNEPSSSFDGEINRNIFGSHWAGITKETIDVVFGEHLPHIYCNHRRLIPEYKYQLHETDVLAYYEDNVPLRDPDTKLPSGNWVDGQWVQEWAHVKGDPVIDENTGEQKVLKRGGVDPVLVDGQPVILNIGDVGFVFDLLVLEGGYKSVTEPNAASYYNSVLSTLKGYISEDLPELKSKFLPNTSAFFSPRSTMGNVPVAVVTGETINISPEQSFDVRVYLTTTAYKDIELRLSLEQAIHDVIFNHIKGTTISVSTLSSEISDLSENIVSVGLDNLSGEYESIRLLSESNSLTLRKQYFVNDKGEIGIKDDIKVSWIDHGE